ncbi:hypothetical protein [Corynebacterium glucuronolyticum]|uniref:ABC-2 type transport system permease protein n=1 Tax=Corynebacterium glucuronolyticum TaxID=39791 RepID=A0AAX1L8G4_9CORY|nr:hypothetical protein [Corynebacterium glucuronolyticum]QRP70675.1 hypothetical protein I6J21_00375 [Corynebacterium glucuronolyticum]
MARRAHFVHGVCAFEQGAVDSGASPLRATLTVVVPGLIMSLIQATCLWLALSVPVTSFCGFYRALMGIGFAFNMLVLAIYTFFGATVGRLIAMALMTLQLVSSNGLYPPGVYSVGARVGPDAARDGGGV